MLVTLESPAPRHARRRGRLCLAVVIALAVSTTLLGSGVAQAKPVLSPTSNPEGIQPTVLVDLSPGARNVQVAESPGGGTVAVSWTVRNATGVDELWARTKRGKAWASKVRVSDPSTSALRPTMDLDSDGSVLLAWSERRGSSPSMVARRVSGSTVAKPTTFNVAAADGPYVAAGPLHDVVAWTAPSGGTVRPFASVDTGGGFPRGVAVSAAGWKHPVINGTLAVNSDAQQVHVTYLSRDSLTGEARSSWSVLETTRTTSWAHWDDVGPTQPLTKGTLRPMIAVDNRNVAGLVFYNVGDQDDLRYPSIFLYDPSVGGTARNRLSEPRSLEAPDGEGIRVLEGIGNRRGQLLATYDTTTGLPALLKQVTRQDESGFHPADWEGDASCAPYGQWFFTWEAESAEIHCLDDGNNESVGAVEVWLNSALAPQYRISPDPTLPGSTIKGSVPDPLVSLIVVTEDLASTANDPVWLLDHTQGGSDRTPSLFSMAKTSPPRITGKARVSKVLTAQVGTWRPGPSRVQYQWYAGRKAIKGATAKTLKLKKRLKGKRISVRLVLSRSGYRSEVVTTAKTKKVVAKKKPKKKHRKR